jgi:predicted DNA-binding protein (MmcQ/YjbR family)
MKIESIRAHCLSMPHSTEDIKPEWGDSILFRIGGKIFASMSLTEVPLNMNVKCTPERFAELLEVDGVRPADYVGRYQWINFRTDGVFRDSEIKDLIRESYENVRSKLPRSALAAMKNEKVKMKNGKKPRKTKR